MFNFKIYFMSEQSPLSLGTEDIKKLLMRYAVPAIVAMTAASLYNMMDSIFMYLINQTFLKGKRILQLMIKILFI